MTVKLIIITPAIPRPEIHSKSFKSLYKSLEPIINFDITHIINLDCPQKILNKGYSYNSTIQNFNVCIPSDVTTHVIKSETANFTSAYCNLWLEAKKFITDNTLMLYFEDDWIISDNFMWQSLIKLCTERLNFSDYFTILSRARPDNSPHILSKGYYQSFVEYIEMNKDYLINRKKVDPDIIKHTFSKYYIKKKLGQENITYNIHYIPNNSPIKNQQIIKPMCKSYYDCETKVCTNSTLTSLDVNTTEEDTKSILNIHIVRYYEIIYATDIGREWLKGLEIKKWDKDSKNVKTY